MPDSSIGPVLTGRRETMMSGNGGGGLSIFISPSLAFHRSLYRQMQPLSLSAYSTQGSAADQPLLNGRDFIDLSSMISK